MKTSAMFVCLIILGLGGCDFHSARDEYNRQLEICAVAERSGLLEPAADACAAALAIAEQEEYAVEQISALLYRLGRLERQRGKYMEAETLMRRSLAIEKQAGEAGAVGTRLVELSLNLAGQGHWQDGAALLEDNLPFMGELEGEDREAAANALRGFSLRLRMQGHTEQAERLKAKAEDLAEDPANHGLKAE